MDKVFKKVEYYEIDYNDFDKFIEETLGKEYECVAENEWNNDSSYDFDIKISEQDKKPESFFMKYTLPDVQKWVRDEPLDKYSTISAGDLLEYLVYIGQLPAGKYLITVSW